MVFIALLVISIATLAGAHWWDRTILHTVGIYCRHKQKDCTYYAPHFRMLCITAY